MKVREIKRRPIVLFDMDGTLTPSRKPIKWNMVKVLAALSKHADIGVVTGSGLNYLSEQCSTLWNEIGSVKTIHLHLLPCNGTQVYRYLDYKWRQTFAKDMRAEIGNETYTRLLTYILSAQKKLLTAHNVSLPFTGNFVSYRQSLLNWCPIGRDAGVDERSSFQEFDKDCQFRNKVKKKLEKKLNKENIKGIEIALGGQTSLDIFPTGWNKTFALQHFPWRDVWFVGDRCEAGGNDHAIYEAVKKEGRAYCTTSPQETIKIITETIVPHLQRST